MYEALRARDIYLVAGCAATGALFLALGTLVGDLLLAGADPRVRGGRACEARRGRAAHGASRWPRWARRGWRRTRRTGGSTSCCTRRPPPIHVFDDGLRAPFVYPLRMVSRLERRFDETPGDAVPLRWCRRGRS